MTLEKIREAIERDPENAWAKDKGWGPVYTAGKTARILVVGQAPGLRSQKSSLPWNDPSGDNLRFWMSVAHETFYDTSRIALVPMDFYYPGKGKGGDMPPRKGFAEKWHPLIRAQMPHIKLMLLIGQYAHAYYLGKRRERTLTDTVRNFRAYLPEYFPLVHPSPRNKHWQQKNPWFQDEVVPELRRRVGEVLQ